MKCRGKTNRATSAKCTSRLLAAFDASSNTNRKLRSRKTIRRRSRKPAALPCSLNKCRVEKDVNDNDKHDDDDDEDNGDNASSEQPQQDGVENTNDSEPPPMPPTPPVKTVETALEGGGKHVRRSQHFIRKGDDDEKLNRAGYDKEAHGDETDLEDDDDDGGATRKSTNLGVGRKDRDQVADRRKKQETTQVRTKHIHPCICDLSTRAQARIKSHIRKRELFEMRHTKRLEAIDAELRAIEEEIARKQQEELEQQELFGDKYEVVGKKKKRMKRSARRASMVSLGVKQVINWRKSPKIKVRNNQVSKLRKNFTAYCGDRPIGLPDIKKIGFGQSPKLPVRITKTTSLRNEFNVKRKQLLYPDSVNKRPPFRTTSFC